MSPNIEALIVFRELSIVGRASFNRRLVAGGLTRLKVKGEKSKVENVL
jgi:hypothetical protein